MSDDDNEKKIDFCLNVLTKKLLFFEMKIFLSENIIFF